MVDDESSSEKGQSEDSPATGDDSGPAAPSSSGTSAAVASSSPTTPNTRSAALPVLVALALAAGGMAVLMGLLPISTYESGSRFGDDSVSCGSAWAPSDDDLTGTGQAACAEGGLNVNRSLSFALLAAMIIFAGAAATSAPSPFGPSGETGQEIETWLRSRDG